MGLSSRSCSPGNAAASAAPAAVSPPGDPAAATAAAEGLPGQVCPAGRWLRARPEGSGWPQARGWRGQGRAPGTAALGQAHLLCLIYILMRHLQLLWGCSQEKRWGISAEATTYAAGGPTSTGEELGSEKGARERGLDALQAPACPLCHPCLGWLPLLRPSWVATAQEPPPAFPTALPQPISTALFCLCSYSMSSSFLSYFVSLT